MAETLSAAYGTPATLDQLDGGGAGTVYMLGNEVDVDEDGGSATHVTWYAPASAPGVTCIVKAYRVSDSTEVATSDGAGFTPTPGVTNQIAFVTPFTPDDGEDYVACVLTRRYTFTGSAAFPFASSPAGVMHARRGRFKITTAGNPVFPDQLANTTNFHVGLVFERAAAPSEVTLTPAVVAVSAVALSPTPGMVSVNLTPATATVTAPPLSPVPGMVSVTLTPAVVTVTAVPLVFPSPATLRPASGSTLRPSAGVTTRP